MEIDKERADKLIKNTYKILADKESKKLLFARVNLLKTADFRYFNIISNLDVSKSQYFLDDFYNLTDEEIYVDLGAYTGDTILKFVDKLNGGGEK